MITKEQILKQVELYFKQEQQTWVPGEWIPYSGPVYDDKEFSAAIKSLLSKWLIFGEIGREFEIKFSPHLGKKFGVLTNSGSSANLLMWAAAKSPNGLNYQPGTKIITPVVCFPTTINPIIQMGFTPVFVDVDLPSLNLNLDQVEAACENDPEIRGITFAHVLGNPPDMDRLEQICKKYDLHFFEDSCDALGSFYKGKPLGSFGIMSTCSFFPAHHMTMGEGGYVATDRGSLRKVITSLRDWGRDCYCNIAKPGCCMGDTACGNRFQEWLSLPVEYDHRYVFSEIGYNLKPLDLQAAMGLEQLKKLPMLDSARRANHKTLTKIFEKHSKHFMLTEATEGSDPCWFGFLVGVKEDAPFKKSDLVRFFEDSKVQTRSYFSGNILYHPGYQHMAKGLDLDKLYPNAKRATTDFFFLGTFAGLMEEQLSYIGTKLDEFMEKYNV